MMINGTRDPVLPYEGGQIKNDDRELGSVMAVEEAINFWKKESLCDDKSTTRDIPNIDTFDETRSEKISYTNCKYGNKIVLITVTNGGHTWPGGRQYEGQKAIGKTSRDFDAANEIWKFFKGL
jgi:polyhydroxybutyrate depolymerase